MTLSPYRVAVFCGGHAGGSPEYAQAADEVGRGLARAGFGIVFGGSNLGLMGKLAYAALEEGGQVIGVLPDSLMGRETPFPELRDLRRVPDFPTRKTMLLNLSRAVVALPGGYGTLDELNSVLGVLIATAEAHRWPTHASMEINRVCDELRNLQAQLFVM